MASKRQQNLVSLKVEKERKEAEKGPAWYYETYLVKVRKEKKWCKKKERLGAFITLEPPGLGKKVGEGK